MKARAVVGLAFAVAGSACTSGPSRLAETFLAPPPSPPLADDCIITGPGDPFSFAGFTLYASAETSIPVGIVVHPEGVPGTFSSIPRAPTDPSSTKPRAAFSFSDGGLTATASVELATRSFRLLERRVLIPDHLWAEPGTPLRLWGRHDGHLLVTAATPFAEPKRVAFLVGCGAIGYGTPTGASPPPRVDERGRVLDVAEGRLELFRDIARTPLFSVDASEHLQVRALRDASTMLFVRIEGTDDDTSLPATVTIEGWIDRSSLEESQSTFDRSHGSIPDVMDRCPGPRILGEVDIAVGAEPPGLAFGTIGSTAHIEIVERRLGFVAIEIEDGDVQPPPGKRWWVPASAVASDCETIAGAKLDDLDGCPCSAPSR